MTRDSAGAANTFLSRCALQATKRARRTLGLVVLSVEYAVLVSYATRRLWSSVGLSPCAPTLLGGRTARAALRCWLAPAALALLPVAAHALVARRGLAGAAGRSAAALLTTATAAVLQFAPVALAADLVCALLGDAGGACPVLRAGAAGATAVACALGVANALALRSRTVVLYSRALRSRLRVAHVSDVHAGSRCAWWVRRVAAAVAAARPDVVAITGDLVDNAHVPQSALAPLFSAAPGAPVVYVLGNHEGSVGPAVAEAAVRGARGVTLLRDGVATMRSGNVRFVGISDCRSADEFTARLRRVLRRASTAADCDDDDVEIAGVGSPVLRLDDRQLARHNEAAAEAAGDSVYTIVLHHKPHGFATVARERLADLFLAGHTHAGQMFPMKIPAWLTYEHCSGAHEEGGSWLHVSPGAGTWGALLRLFGFNTVVLIDIIPSGGAPKTR
eukprot:m51a1_g1993 hypothetical protein (447) ;mRNA; r:1199179-1200589